jgi:hypothetical protein
MLAHARFVLKSAYNLSNHETANIHTSLSTLQERQLPSRTHKSPPPKSRTLTQRAHPRQDPTIPRPTANHPSQTTTKRRTRNKSRLHLAHTPKSYDPNSNPVGNKRMTVRTRTDLATILTKQQQKNFQKLLPTKRQPVHIQIKSKTPNDNMMQKPKTNLTAKRTASEPYRTKSHTPQSAINRPHGSKFWPTSYSSSEFGQNYTHHHFDIRPKPNSQINFPTDQHSNKMPTPKIDVIRLQQVAVVTNLVEIARYTHTQPVYTEMTQEQFNKTVRNLNRISKLCNRSIRATRYGQRLAPKVGPYAHYNRLFDDFCEILQLESDKILTQKEYLLYRLVPKPPTPPKITGLRNIVNHYYGESEYDESNSSPQY